MYNVAYWQLECVEIQWIFDKLNFKGNGIVFKLLKFQLIEDPLLFIDTRWGI